MLSKIQKWGNSQGVRLPKALLASVDFSEGDEVEIIAEEDKIIIRPSKRHITLKERMAGYSGDYSCSEADTGDAVGKEIL